MSVSQALIGVVSEAYHQIFFSLHTQYVAFICIRDQSYIIHQEVLFKVIITQWKSVRFFVSQVLIAYITVLISFKCALKTTIMMSLSKFVVFVWVHDQSDNTFQSALLKAILYWLHHPFQWRRNESFSLMRMSIIGSKDNLFLPVCFSQPVACCKRHLLLL